MSTATTRVLEVDAIISKLLAVRKSKPGTHVELPQDDIVAILAKAREVLLSQRMLLEIRGPINICGDIHGQYQDLLRLFEMGSFPPLANYLFLGDYVDRANQSIETICLLLCFKIKYPENFFLLRGNHESSSINRIYGFYDECKRRYSIKLWRTFGDVFNCLPVAALVEDKIFCMHGGLSNELIDLHQINLIARPCQVPDEGLLCDLLWADPDRDLVGWANSDRGVSYTFGADVIRNFLEEHDLDLICKLLLWNDWCYKPTESQREKEIVEIPCFGLKNGIETEREWTDKTVKTNDWVVVQVGRIKSWRTVTSFKQSESLLQFLVRQITVANSKMQGE
mmetsp:Transcript_12022/g.22271  ORF Transcript_12022/g.22271 Transcript_12022/m.22271 type:complete len:338 (+) Transcript_12022:87-1100(+)